MKTLIVEIVKPNHGGGNNVILTDNDGKYIQQFWCPDDHMFQEIMHLIERLGKRYDFEVEVTKE
jgi:hypothetical protein